MEQISLFDVPSKPVEYFRNGMFHRNHGRWEERDFNGYRQTRYHGEPWMFYICGFTGPPLADGSDSVGHVLMFDGSHTKGGNIIKQGIRKKSLIVITHFLALLI